jgi:hypothetical protein
MSACLSIHMEQLGSHGTDFGEIWELNISRKTVEKIQVSLQFAKNDTLYMKINMHLRSYLTQFFLDWEICQEWHTLYMKINMHLRSYLAQFFLDWEICQ